MPVASHGIQSDSEEDDSECRCPGYYQTECTANWWQGCVWTDAGTGNAAHPEVDSHWCQCDSTYVVAPKVFTGRYIRPSGGTAIYWEKMGVKYWVRACDMCDTELNFDDTPCNNHWVDVDQSYIDQLSTEGGYSGGDGVMFECTQHPNHDLYVAPAPAVVDSQACHAMDHKMIQGCLNNPQEIATGCNVADVRCCSMDGTSCNSGNFPETFTFTNFLTSTGTACSAGECNNVADTWCHSGVTFFQAQELCEANGERLCTRAEVEGGVCCGTGCSHNSHLIWFDDEYGPASLQHCSSLAPVTLTASSATTDNAPVSSQAQGAVPFGSSSLSGYCDNTGEGSGATFGGDGIHCFDNINDGEYGNDKSWIAGAAYGGKRFVGVTFSRPDDITQSGTRYINSFSVARDRTGAYSDRTGGTYEFQYTLTAGASFDTPDAEWCSGGTFTRDDAGAKGFRLSHQIPATAIRIIVSDADAAIDELEAWYQTDVQENPWTLVVQYGTSAYPESTDAVGTLSETGSAFAKLSDADINALPTQSDGTSYTYWKLTSDSATGAGRDTLILRTTGSYDDADPSYGWGSDWAVCTDSTQSAHQCTTWSTSNPTNRVDTLPSKMPDGVTSFHNNDCNRWFTGYNNILCYAANGVASSYDNHCWSLGNSCPEAGAHATRLNVKMYKCTGSC